LDDIIFSKAFDIRSQFTGSSNDIRLLQEACINHYDTLILRVQDVMRSLTENGAQTACQETLGELNNRKAVLPQTFQSNAAQIKSIIAVNHRLPSDHHFNYGNPQTNPD